MKTLQAFMRESALPVENAQVAVSKRFVDENGEAILWEIKALTPEEDDLIRRSCTVLVSMRGGKQEKFNQNRYLEEFVTASVVYPNLHDVELQDSYGVKDAKELLKKMLIAGEYLKLTAKAQEISGFNITLEEKVEEAKNS